MESTLGRTCSICGAEISDGNPDGIGFGCRKVYTQAYRKIFFENAERANTYNKIVNDIIVGEFGKIFEHTKFRSDFKKQFYPSVLEQYKTKGFITLRQKEIMIDMMAWKDFEWSKRMGCSYLAGAVGAQKIMFLEWKRNITQEEKDHVINLANKLRNEKR